MGNIKVSVIMPVYNSGSFLDAAVQSILSQDFDGFELILVDDGSTDGSSEKCDAYAEKDHRVIVIHQENGGICNARNAALKIAKGEYIAFSDHDDEYLPGLLETAYNNSENGRFDIVKFFRRNPFIKDGKIYRYQPQRLYKFDFIGQEIFDNIFYLLNTGTLVCVWDGIYKRSVILDNNIEFDSNYRSGGEDLDFNIRLLGHINSIKAIDKVFYIHNLRIGYSTSTKYDKRKIDCLKLLARNTYKVLSEKVAGLDMNEDYACYIFKSIICPIIMNVSNPHNGLSDKERKDLLEGLKTSEGVPSSLMHIRYGKMFKDSKKYGLAYFLYKNKLYGSLMYMFYRRNKEKGIIQ